jgi:hypothetical protein
MRPKLDDDEDEDEDEDEGTFWRKYTPSQEMHRRLTRPRAFDFNHAASIPHPMRPDPRP